MSTHDMPRQMPEADEPQEVRMQPSAEKARTALEGREREVKREAVGLSLARSVEKWGGKFKTLAASAGLLAVMQGCGTLERNAPHFVNDRLTTRALEEERGKKMEEYDKDQEKKLLEHIKKDAPNVSERARKALLDKEDVFERITEPELRAELEEMARTYAEASPEASERLVLGGQDRARSMLVEMGRQVKKGDHTSIGIVPGMYSAVSFEVGAGEISQSERDWLAAMSAVEDSFQQSKDGRNAKNGETFGRDHRMDAITALNKKLGDMPQKDRRMKLAQMKALGNAYLKAMHEVADKGKE